MGKGSTASQGCKYEVMVLVALHLEGELSRDSMWADPISTMEPTMYCLSEIALHGLFTWLLIQHKPVWSNHVVHIHSVVSLYGVALVQNTCFAHWFLYRVFASCGNTAKCKVKTTSEGQQNWGPCKCSWSTAASISKMQWQSNCSCWLSFDWTTLLHNHNQPKGTTFTASNNLTTQTLSLHHCSNKNRECVWEKMNKIWYLQRVFAWSG